MYVTAHRVRTREGAEGTNSYLFLHLHDPIPVLRPDEPDVAYISQFAAGTCIAEKEDIQPGGNTVECSLDVAGPDDASPNRARIVLGELRKALSERLPPVRASAAGLSAAFNATLDFDGHESGVLNAFDELSERLLKLLPLRSGSKTPTGPLVVWVHYRPDGIELSLPSATRARLGASIAHRMKIVLPAEVVSQFPGQGRDALLEVASVLTGKDRARLRRAGGLLFVDPASDAEVFRWPESRARPAPKKVKRSRPTP